MRSSNGRGISWAIALAASAWPALASAQTAYRGFTAERFYPSAPGAGWFAMDTLDMRGALGGALAMTVSYAHNPLRVTDGAPSLTVISDQVFTDVGMAITLDRMRFSLDLNMPFLVTGPLAGMQSATVRGYTVTSPSVDLGANPDTLADARVGFDARIVGGPTSAFRLGAGTMLIIPSGVPSDFVTDGTYRGMLRVHVAGDLGLFTYAGHVGVHLRLRDDGPSPEGPRGQELLVGIAGGARIPVGHQTGLEVIVGPEFYGATALRSLFGGTSTSLEALLGGRVQGTATHGIQWRAKLGLGTGLYQHFGAPDFRAVVGVEFFERELRL